MLSVVVPVFNEEHCLPELHRRLAAVRANHPHLDVRVVYVDDGSSDRSRELIQTLAVDHEWVRGVLLARNFGHQLAVTAGLDAAGDADAVAIIDSDLQDPPELIPAMLDLMQREHLHVVYGKRRKRPGDTWFKRTTASAFYRIIRAASGIDIPMDTGDFRVIDRRALAVLRSMREHNRFLRGMIPWTGLSSAPFEYDRDPRFAGTTKYPLRKMVAFAANAIFSLSVAPIRLLQSFGVALACAGLVGMTIAAAWAVIAGGVAGLVWLALLNLMLTGTMLSGVAIVGGYVHRIQDEARGRPLYVVDRVVESGPPAKPPGSVQGTVLPCEQLPDSLSPQT